MQKKITIFNFALCQVIDFIQYKFKHCKQYLISENRYKDVLNHLELCEITIQR